MTRSPLLAVAVLIAALGLAGCVATVASSAIRTTGKVAGATVGAVGDVGGAVIGDGKEEN